MIPKKPSICHMCEYYVSGMDNPRGKPVCRAFPEGIPDEVLFGGYDHRRPLWDESITFRLSKEFTAEDLKQWERDMIEIERQEMIGTALQMENGEQPT